MINNINLNKNLIFDLRTKMKDFDNHNKIKINNIIEDNTIFEIFSMSDDILTNKTPFSKKYYFEDLKSFKINSDTNDIQKIINEEIINSRLLSRKRIINNYIALKRLVEYK